MSSPMGELIAEWRPRQGNPFHGRLLRPMPGLHSGRATRGGSSWIPREPSVTIGSPDDALTLTAEVRMFGVPSSLITLERGDLSMHAAAVEVGGGAVVLAGPSRYGKTTLAAAFAAAGHRVLAEDMATCTLRDAASCIPVRRSCACARMSQAVSAYLIEESSPSGSASSCRSMAHCVAQAPRFHSSHCSS